MTTQTNLHIRSIMNLIGCTVTTVSLMMCLTATAIAVHPYHVSLTEIQWNEKTSSLEVAVCVWPADLEKALSVQEQMPIDLDKTNKLDEMILRYVTRKFNCRRAKTKSTKIRWVGYETTNKQTWIYFELNPTKIHDGTLGPAENKVWLLQNKMFFELNPDQLNQINFVSLSGELVTGVCSPGKTEFALQPTSFQIRR